MCFDVKQNNFIFNNRKTKENKIIEDVCLLKVHLEVQSK